MITDNQLIVQAKAGNLMAKNELIRRYKILLKIKVSAYSRAPIPTAALDGEAMKILLHTVEKFDPSRGIQFKTFLEQNLKGLYRYAAKTKNVARIPEHKVLQINLFQQAKSIVQTQKGREPTAHELADSLGWSPTQVQSMETALSRRDIAASGIETLHAQERFKDRMEDLLEFEYFGMVPEEKLIYDFSLGRHGKPRLDSVKDIAARTGLSTDKVYAIKSKIAQRITARI